MVSANRPAARLAHAFAGVPDAEQRIVRTVADRLVEMAERGRVLATESRGDAEIASRESEVGIERDHPLEAAHRLVVAAENNSKIASAVWAKDLVVGQDGRRAASPIATRELGEQGLQPNRRE